MKIVPFTADKPRLLKFGARALVQLEEDAGKPITDLLDSITIKSIIKILFHGLKWEDKELKLDEVGDLMDSAIEEHGDFATVSKMLVETLVSSFGKKAIPSKK